MYKNVKTKYKKLDCIKNERRYCTLIGVNIKCYVKIKMYVKITMHEMLHVRVKLHVKLNNNILQCVCFNDMYRRYCMHGNYVYLSLNTEITICINQYH